MTTLNLNSIVDVVVEVALSSAPRATFNQALIIGSSTKDGSLVIPTSERVREYENTDDMLTDGFTVASPEYIATSLYFAQSPAPQVVWIGCQDLTDSPNESVYDALVACRAKEADWYIAYPTGAIDEDIIDSALWVESVTPSTLLSYQTADPNVYSNSSTSDLPYLLKASNYKRAFGMYSTVDQLIAGIIGVACGLNTGLANSAFTIFGKSIVGGATEDLTYNQKQIVEGKNCNAYLSYANYYSIFEPGVMANGYFLDQMINRDMFVNDIQLSCMDLIYQTPKIPQTESGMTMIHNVLVQACENARIRGYLGPGTYTGIPFLNLNTGDAMPNGYVIQSLPLSKQSSADREARKATPFYITIKEAGAVQSITIQVNVSV